MQHTKGHFFICTSLQLCTRTPIKVVEVCIIGIGRLDDFALFAKEGIQDVRRVCIAKMLTGPALNKLGASPIRQPGDRLTKWGRAYSRNTMGIPLQPNTPVMRYRGSPKASGRGT